jgi:hypothetical protein
MACRGYLGTHRWLECRITHSYGPQDADGDGYTNLEEYLNSTNPLVKD